MEIHNIVTKGYITTASIPTSASWSPTDEGKIIYVDDEGKFYFGSSGGWFVLDAGVDGTSGTSGNSGTSGSSGTSGGSGSSGSSGSSGTSGLTTIIPTNIADHNVSGMLVTASVGVSATLFSILYRDSGYVYLLSDADQATTMPAVAMLTASAASSGSYDLLTLGWARDDSWAWTPGGLLYADTVTSGGMTQTKPSGTGDQIQIVGYAYTGSIIYFNPNYTLIEVA